MTKFHNTEPDPPIDTQKQSITSVVDAARIGELDASSVATKEDVAPATKAVDPVDPNVVAVVDANAAHAADGSGLLDAKAVTEKPKAAPTTEQVCSMDFILAVVAEPNAALSIEQVAPAPSNVTAEAVSVQADS